MNYAKTYTQFCRENPIDWVQIFDLIIRGELSFELYRTLFSSWDSGAIGTLSSDLERRDNGEPMSEALLQLDLQLYVFVEDKKWIDAQNILIEMEKIVPAVLEEEENSRVNNDAQFQEDRDNERWMWKHHGFGS